MGEWFPTVLGVTAGLVSTSSFVPQVLKAWRDRDTAALSKRTYVVTVTAFTLWSVYGFLIGSAPIVIFNLLSLVLSGTILVLKIRDERRGAVAQPPGTEPEPTRPG